MIERVAAWMRRHEYLTAAAFLAALLCAWYAPLFAGQQMGQPATFWGMHPWATDRPPDYFDMGRSGEGDIAIQMQPLTALAREQIHDGDLPTVNPYGSGGLPLFADMQTALAFPPTWLALVLTVEDAWGWIKVLELLIAGLGAYALARHFRVGRGASLVAATVYMLSAPLVVWIQYPTGVVSTFLPWLLLASDRLYAQITPRRFAALAAVVGLSLLAGHPETAFSNTSAVGVYLLVRGGLDRGRAIGDRLRAGGLWVSAHVLGVGIAAVAVIPFLAAHPHSISAEFRAGDLTSLTLPLTSSLVLAIPDIYGNGRHEYFGPLLFYPVMAAYFGLTTLVLSVIGLIRHRRAPQAIGLTAMAVVTLMTIYGIAPVYWFIDHVYPWSQAGLSHTFEVVALSATIGAGAGIDALLRRPLSRGQVAATVAATGGVVAIVLAIAVKDKLLPAPRSVEEDALLRFGVVLAATGICLYLLGRLRSAGIAVAIVMAALLIDLFQFQPWNVLRPPERAAPHDTPGLAFVKQQPEPFRIGLIRPTAADLPVLSPNIPTAHRLDSVEGYDFPAPRRWMDLRWDVLGHRGSGREILIYSPVPRGPVLTAQRMINTRYHLAAPGTKRPPGLRVAYFGPDLTVFEDPQALPRAYVVGSVREMTEEQTTLALQAGAVRPDREALVPPDAPPVRSAVQPLRQASFEVVAPDRYRVRVPAGNPGWLVVGQSYTPQWEARVDGRDAELFPTNLALMGLPVDGREHVVELRRGRADLVLGAAITLASIAFVLGLLAYDRRRRAA